MSHALISRNKEVRAKAESLATNLVRFCAVHTRFGVNSEKDRTRRRESASPRHSPNGAPGRLSICATDARQHGLRDLMTRMGHDSPRAAMIYQHVTTVEDRAIADRLSSLVDAHRAESDEMATQTGDVDDDGDDGSAGVLVSVR